MNKPNEDEIALKWGEIKRWETQRSIFGKFHDHLSLPLQNGDRYNYPQFVGKCHFPLAQWIAGAQLEAVNSGGFWSQVKSNGKTAEGRLRITRCRRIRSILGWI